MRWRAIIISLKAFFAISWSTTEVLNTIIALDLVFFYNHSFILYVTVMVVEVSHDLTIDVLVSYWLSLLFVKYILIFNVYSVALSHSSVISSHLCIPSISSCVLHEKIYLIFSSMFRCILSLSLCADIVTRYYLRVNSVTFQNSVYKYSLFATIKFVVDTWPTTGFFWLTTE